MPQLNPDTWLLTLITTWMTLNTITNLVRKTTPISPPTKAPLEITKTTPWTWPWQ